MKSIVLSPFVALGLAGPATAAIQVLYEEQMARDEES